MRVGQKIGNKCDKQAGALICGGLSVGNREQRAGEGEGGSQVGVREHPRWVARDRLTETEVRLWEGLEGSKGLTHTEVWMENVPDC